MTSFQKGQRVEELHDFNTGLNYQYNHDTDLCTVSNLTAGPFDVNGEEPKKLRIKTPKEFFDLENAAAQFAGMV